jgi:hypothetical protein
LTETWNKSIKYPLAQAIALLLEEKGGVEVIQQKALFIEELPEQDKSVVKIFLDAFITKGKLKQLAL